MPLGVQVFQNDRQTRTNLQNSSRKINVYVGVWYLIVKYINVWNRKDLVMY